MTLHLTNPTRRLIVTLLAVFSMVLAALPTAFLAPASADHDADTETLLGGFEIDGDFTPGTLAPPGKDWTSIGTVTAADDLDAPNDDLIDGKEEQPSGWTFHEGTSNPAKNDILRTFFASDTHNERPFVYLAYEYFDAPGQGASTINFELNQNTTTGGAIVDREPGDLLIAYDYPGGEAPVVIETFEWNGSAWIASTNEIVAGDVNGIDRAWPDVAPFNTTSESATVKAQHFGEVAVDLKSVVGDDCITVGSAWSKTRTSGSNPLTSELTDYIKPVNVPPINTCGSIEVQKEDEDGELLDGATFELWMDVEDPENGTGGVFDEYDTLVDSCVTGETGQEAGECAWDDLEPGRYWVVEVAAPDHYTLDPSDVEQLPDGRDGVVHEVDLDSLEDHIVPPGTFVNPRIPYAIDVRPDDKVNLVDDEHVFVVTLTKGADANGTPDTDTQQLDVLVAGATIDLHWSSVSGSNSITFVEDANGGPSAPADGTDTTCVTRDDSGGASEKGTCLVTVNSSSEGSGTLTGTFTTPYQNVSGAATDPGWWTNSARTIEDAGSKSWVDYSTTVGTTATNLVGEAHEFTIDVTGPAGSDLGSPQSKVGFWWNGDGSVDEINGPGPVSSLESDVDLGDRYECDVVPDAGDKTTGTCTVEVSSSSVGGGAITLAYINVGDIDDDGDDDEINYDVDGEGDADETGTPVLENQQATKRWVDFDADVEASATNLVGEDHTFELWISSSDSTIDLDGHTLNWEWDLDGTVTQHSCTTDTLTFADDTSDDGRCTFTVSSDDVASGTITLTSLVLADGTIEGDDLTVDFYTQGDPVDVGDQPADTATKHWVDFNVVVGPDAENLVGEDHTFYIEVSSTDTALDLNGHTVNYTWFAPDAAEAEAGSCLTDETVLPGHTEETDGTCAVTVDSDVTGQGAITIVSLVLTEGTVDGLDSTVAFDVTGETGPAADTATKTWVDYQVSVSPETAENLTGSNHVFTVLVERDSGDGGGFQPLAGANPSLEITDGPGDILAPANLCASDGTDVDGECTVTITSAETGTTTVQASYLGDAADSEAVTFRSNPATKKWVDYLIDVDPDRAVNPVGTTHTFTVTLQRIEDGVAAAAADESVALSITGPGDIIEVPAGTIDGDARGGSCTTDAAGQCDVTIASDEVGDTTLTAEYAAQVGESTGTFSDSGLKLWRSDPAIELVKNADIEPTADGLKIINCNEGGCPETEFTFTVTNVGGVHLHDVTVTDDKFGPITLQDDELEVGESTTGTATYTPSRDEIDAGLHENLGTASGVSPDGETVRDTDPERVEIIEVLPNVIERPEPAPEPEPEPAPLPRTGTDAAWMSLTALLALLLGWSMVWLSRRREIEDQA